VLGVIIAANNLTRHYSSYIFCWWTFMMVMVICVMDHNIHSISYIQFFFENVNFMTNRNEKYNSYNSLNDRPLNSISSISARFSNFLELPYASAAIHKSKAILFLFLLLINVKCRNEFFCKVFVWNGTKWIIIIIGVKCSFIPLSLVWNNSTAKNVCTQNVIISCVLKHKGMMVIWENARYSIYRLPHTNSSSNDNCTIVISFLSILFSCLALFFLCWIRCFFFPLTTVQFTKPKHHHHHCKFDAAKKIEVLNAWFLTKKQIVTRDEKYLLHYCKDSNLCFHQHFFKLLDFYISTIEIKTTLNSYLNKSWVLYLNGTSSLRE